MCVVKARTKGGPHGGVSVYRCIGGVGIPVFHRSGRFFRPAASSLSRACYDTIPSRELVLDQSAFNRVGFVIVNEIQLREQEKDDSENCSGNGSWTPGVRLRRDGPGRALAGN